MLLNPVGPLKFIAIPPFGNLVVAFRYFVRSHVRVLLAAGAWIKGASKVRYGSVAAVHEVSNLAIRAAGIERKPDFRRGEPAS